MAKESSGGFLSFAKSSLIFFVGNTLSKIITVALLPLYTNTLSSTDFGYYDVSVTCVTLLTSFIYCDVWTSVMRFMRDDLRGEAPKVVIASGWVIFGGSTALYYAIGLVCGIFFEIPSLGLILLYGTFLNLQSMFSYIARGWGDNICFAISGIICSVVNVGLNIVMVAHLGWGYESLYVASILGSFAQCIFLFIALKMWKKFSLPNFKKIRELFRYSAPLCLNSVAYWLLNSLGRVVISFTLSLSASGIFAVGSRFGSAISLATTCFTYAWQDISFTPETRKNTFYSNAVTRYTVFLMDALALLLPTVSLFFPILVGMEYAESYVVIPSFLAVAVLSAVSTFIGNIFYVIKDTKTISKTMVVSCLFNVFLTYPLTAAFGINGTNLATFTAFAINIVLRLIILKKKLMLNFNFRPIVGRATLVIFAYIVYTFNLLGLNIIFLIIGLCFFIWMYRTKIKVLARAVFGGFYRGKRDQHE